MPHDDSPVRIRMTLPSGPLAVRAALARILAELDPLNLPPDALGTIEIVLAEALNNVVEHAYPPGGDAGSIDIHCRTDTDALHVCIIDGGRAMPEHQVPDGKEADLTRELSDLPEGGFGWFLIHKLARDVEYRRCNDRNILNLRLPVSQPG